MARALAMTATVHLSGTNTNPTTDDITPTSALIFDQQYNIQSGTSDGQADRIYHTRVTLAASGTTSIDLSGSLTDDLGQAVVFVEVTGILVRNRETTYSGRTLNVGGDANGLVNWVGAAADFVKVKPGGTFFIYDPGSGYAVTAGTGDILLITNTDGSNTVSYDVWIIGRSA